MAEETESPSSKLGVVKRGRPFPPARGIGNDKMREIREFVKNDPLVRYAAQTDGF